LKFFGRELQDSRDSLKDLWAWATTTGFDVGDEGGLDVNVAGEPPDCELEFLAAIPDALSECGHDQAMLADIANTAYTPNERMFVAEDRLEASPQTDELRRRDWMPDPAYHTNSLEYPPEHRNVHHNNNECPSGKQIKTVHREPGTGNKPLCERC